MSAPSASGDAPDRIHGLETGHQERRGDEGYREDGAHRDHSASGGGWIGATGPLGFGKPTSRGEQEEGGHARVRRRVQRGEAEILDEDPHRRDSQPVVRRVGPGRIGKAGIGGPHRTDPLSGSL